MNLDLTGRTALITGGAKRIGRSVAIALAERGADAVIHYRGSFAEAESAADEIRRLGRKAWTLQADLTVEADLSSLMERAFRVADGVDILINNASEFPSSTLETVTLEELIRSVTIEAWTPLLLGRNLAQMTDKGHVVNVLDTRAFGYDWDHAAYHAAKHMLRLFTREMAIRFAPNLAVNGVAPGLILPPEGKDHTYLEGLMHTVPLKRIGSPADVSDAVLFLLTSEFITGQVIFVDGGRHLAEAIVG